jgi:hypothetical protein
VRALARILTVVAGPAFGSQGDQLAAVDNCLSEPHQPKQDTCVKTIFQPLLDKIGPTRLEFSPTRQTVVTSAARDAGLIADLLKGLGPGGLAKTGSFDITAHAPSAGNWELQLFMPASANRGRSALNGVTLAFTRARFVDAGSKKVRVRLTKRARRLLGGARGSRELMVVMGFIRPDAPTSRERLVFSTRRVTLKP